MKPSALTSTNNILNPPYETSSPSSDPLLNKVQPKKKSVWFCCCCSSDAEDIDNEQAVDRKIQDVVSNGYMTMRNEGLLNTNLSPIKASLETTSGQTDDEIDSLTNGLESTQSDAAYQTPPRGAIRRTDITPSSDRSDTSNYSSAVNSAANSAANSPNPLMANYIEVDFE